MSGLPGLWPLRSGGNRLGYPVTLTFPITITFFLNLFEPPPHAWPPACRCRQRLPHPHPYPAPHLVGGGSAGLAMLRCAEVADGRRGSDATDAGRATACVRRSPIRLPCLGGGVGRTRCRNPFTQGHGDDGAGTGYGGTGHGVSDGRVLCEDKDEHDTGFAVCVPHPRLWTMFSRGRPCFVLI